jgi:hypothetical protein
MLLFNLFELYMNKFIYYSIFLLLIIIILGCTFSKKSYEEAFIPKIVKETYRPLERNIRRNFEGFYDKSSTDISNLFRKFGIL